MRLKPWTWGEGLAYVGGIRYREEPESDYVTGYRCARCTFLSIDHYGCLARGLVYMPRDYCDNKPWSAENADPEAGGG